MGRDIKFRQAYQLLTKKEKEKCIFTIDELINAMKWKKSTVKTYINKKWSRFIKRRGNDYIVKGLLDYTEDEFVRLSSQKQELSENPFRPKLDLVIEALVNKARESAILAVDIYNKPATTFKTHAFIVLMIIAWTSLFHAIFERDGLDYYEKDSEGNYKVIDGDKKAWNLGTCVKEYFKGNYRPIECNLEFMIGLRNKIEHRFLPALDLRVAGECQAMLLNFEELILREFGPYFALSETLSLALQFTTWGTDAKWRALKVLRAREYQTVDAYIEKFRDSLDNEVYADPNFSFRVYLIPKLGNHATSSDIAVEFIKYDHDKPDEMEQYMKQIAFIKEKQIQVANQGKLKPSQVAQRVSKAINKPFSVYDHTLAWKKYKVRPEQKGSANCDVRFCQYDVAHNDYVYTEDWVDFLIKKLSDDNEYKSLKNFKMK